MKKHKILVIGQGSIGKRHIQNLQKLSQEVLVFSYRKKLGKTIDSFENVEYIEDLEKGIEACEGVIVCNRNDQHIEVALKVAKKKKHLLVEKPLTINLKGVKELEEVIKKNNLVFKSGFMMRYHPNLIFIKNFLDQNNLGEIFYASACVGQFLPDWRPGTNYKNNYAAYYKWGGGVTLDLIHEIDLINWFFGESNLVSGFLNKSQNLDIETEAISNITLKTKSNIICNLELDYLSPILRRKMEIVGQKGILNWDFTKGEVTFANKEVEEKLIHKTDEEFQRNDMFIDELKDFLTNIDTNRRENDSLQDAINAIKIVLSTFKSNENKRFINPKDL